MSTLAVLRSRIADRLQVGTALNSQIDEKINAAIEHYESERFWFVETTDTFATIASQKSYGTADDLPSDIREIDSLKVTIASNHFVYPKRKPYQFIESDDQTGRTSRPLYFGFYNEKIHFLPIPDASYTVTLSYKKSFTELSNDADTNNWTVYARQLLEHHAMMLIYADVIQNQERAMLMGELVKSDIISLRQRSDQMLSSDEVIPTSW